MIDIPAIIAQLDSGICDFSDVAQALRAFGTPDSFVPSLSASGSMTASSATGGTCVVWEINKMIFANYYITDIVIGGTPSSEVRAGLPVAAARTIYSNGAVPGNPSSDSGFMFLQSSSIVGLRKTGVGNWRTGVGNDFLGMLIYERT